MHERVRGEVTTADLAKYNGVKDRLRKLLAMQIIILMARDDPIPIIG